MPHKSNEPIYICVGEEGVYSYYSAWVVGVFDTLDGAKQAAIDDNTEKKDHGNLGEWQIVDYEGLDLHRASTDHRYDPIQYSIRVASINERISVDRYMWTVV